MGRVGAQAGDTGLVGARLVRAAVFAREPPSTKPHDVLHLLDGLTLEGVAEEVGLSVSGVRKRLRTPKQHVAELEDI